MKIYGLPRKVVSKTCAGKAVEIPALGSEIGEYRSPLPHQIEALDYTFDRNKIALFMEMRLGKTLVAIRWAKRLIEKSGFRPETIFNKTHRVLIVAPLTVLPSWAEELKKEAVKDDNIHWLLGTKPQRLLAANPFMLNEGWFLVNYEGLRACPELLKHCWFAVIADESTKIRNPKAQITKLMNEELCYVKNKAILSGLPNPESPMDYFEQFRFLHGGFMGFNNFWAFRLRYFQQGYTDWDWFPKPKTLEGIKSTVGKFAFVLTRKQAKVGAKKIYEKRFVYMNPKQKKLQKTVEKDFECEDSQTKWAMVKFLWLAQLAGGFLPEKLTLISEEKCKEILNLLTGELKNEKVVIWFRFNHELEHLRKYLNFHRIPCLHIVGDVPLQKRRESSIAFRSNPKIRAMLAQVKCGKFGLDWSVASTAIYYSNSYDMEDRAQSEDRIIHPKSVEPVLYIDLVTKDSVDEDIIEALRDKTINAKFFMNKIYENWRKRREEKSKKAKTRSPKIQRIDESRATYGNQSPMDACQ